MSLNVTKELTTLARKLGYTGKAPDTVAKAINAITSVASAGGGSGSCDCEPLIVPIEYSDDSETDGWSERTTKTTKEIFDALEAGKQVWLYVELEEDGKIFNYYYSIDYWSSSHRLSMPYCIGAGVTDYESNNLNDFMFKLINSPK